jgi:hypothetical protein
LRVILDHPLNAHFVDIEAGLQIREVVELNGISVIVHAGVPEGSSFATIVCSGSVEADIETAHRGTESERTEGSEPVILPGRFVVRHGIAPEIAEGFAHACSQIEPVLEQIGENLRWHFNLPGEDSVFGGTMAHLYVDGREIEMEPMPHIVPGENSGRVTRDGVRQVVAALDDGSALPLAHQLLREAWNLHWTSHRSSLVIGMTAAEVGVKQHIARLLPDTQFLLEEMPTPPLDKLIARILPTLPIRVDVAADRRYPPHLRRVIKEAIEDRNRVTHRGSTPSLYLRMVLESIREFLYLLDFYEGHAWAKTHLSARTLSDIGVTDPQL